ncbi:hypothetical protein [Cellulomonas sp. HZM]|uniref:8-oxoguanine DNA glycosylase OGG fold protein n=1 Tax=Cellulomonas sp. HZM TaxID=1454010 RepID=UPI00068CEF0B|nr:hypothetical protein [Cellulomonas sp. HZM]
MIDVPLPTELAQPGALGRRTDLVLAQRISVRTAWWADELAKHSLGDEMFSTADASLTRADVFALAEGARRDAAGARRLLWATLAWGTGTKNRNNRARIAAVAAAPERIGEALAQAASLAQTDADSAYRVMAPEGRNLVRFMGPPFSTKFLYFAGGGEADHPCLILDSFVAAALTRLPAPSTWRPPGQRFWWPASTYAAYTELLQRWSSEASTAQHRDVAADEIERWLFAHGGRRS